MRGIAIAEGDILGLSISKCFFLAHTVRLITAFRQGWRLNSF